MRTPKSSTDQPYWRWWQSLDESTRQTFIKTLWQAEIERLWYAEARPDPTAAFCAVCGEPVERSNLGGKPRLYCNAACKQQAVRNRAKDRKQRALSRRP